MLDNMWLVLLKIVPVHGCATRQGSTLESAGRVCLFIGQPTMLSLGAAESLASTVSFAFLESGQHVMLRQFAPHFRFLVGCRYHLEVHTIFGQPGSQLCIHSSFQEFAPPGLQRGRVSHEKQTRAMPCRASARTTERSFPPVPERIGSAGVTQPALTSPIVLIAQCS